MHCCAVVNTRNSRSMEEAVPHLLFRPRRLGVILNLEREIRMKLVDRVESMKITSRTLSDSAGCNVATALWGLNRAKRNNAPAPLNPINTVFACNGSSFPKSALAPFTGHHLCRRLQVSEQVRTKNHGKGLPHGECKLRRR